ncbi:protein of unknown function DUF4378 [Macleaya cordata]|uniref:DUF4378 domain-containing protein n=1 Tax=Macleaya cordata TaxID=56857 RepID=A0A200Q1H2_MACCD|nr:protein of unknown function DUF4378 [Macleaya cordata]
MGGLLHLFDFHHAGTSRKLLRQQRYTDGLEAPRNSLELPIETSQCYNCFGENIPYAFQAMANSSKHTAYPVEAPMKELIDDEISKEPDTRRNAPSVVARLMGMDMIPLEAKPARSVQEKKNEMIEHNFSRQEQDGSIRRSPLGLKPSKQKEHGVPSNSPERDSDQSRNSKKYKKPQPRQHPQEEQLQKFKKEFEAWQAARVWENSKIVDPGNIPRRWLAQEHLNKEKMALYADSKRVTACEKPRELKGHKAQPALKSSSQEETILQSGRREPFQDYQKERSPLRNESSNFAQVSLMTHVEKQGKSDVPTRIVILKPGPDRTAGSEESWTGSSEIAEEEGSIQDFLEEVKERLRFEMQGKSTKRDSVVRGGGIETPFSEKPSNPKQIARHIAKQVRESVTRDLGMNLLRSESTRSYASELQVNGPDSPEFINRDTRKFLSERLRNVLKSETILDIPTDVGGSSRASMVYDEESRVRPVGDVLKTVNRGNYWEHVKDELEMQSRSFRYGKKYDDALDMGERSPRNLVRSLSAPVSGTSFGKLLLEDRHILTGAHIRRKHEATENVSVEVRKTRKEKFNFRGKVSNLRSSLSFKGRLFGRKIQSLEEPGSNDSNAMKDIMSGSTALTNFENVLENSTEVPPSPASFCSTPREEYYRTWDHPSPVSTLDVPSIEDQTVPEVFKDISSNLTELRRQLNKLGVDGSEDMSVQEEPQEAEMVDLEDQAEVYIRDVLVISGLYDGSSDLSFSRWDPQSKPIANWVFEKVEESYEKRAEETGTTENHSESKVDHKILFDLLNEALSTILGPSVTMSKFKKKLVGSAKMPPPRGKKLLDVVWQMICMYIYPECDGYYYSLDAMVTRDLGMIPWLGMMDDDVDVIGREMENWILRELIGEFVRDLLL